MSDSDATKIFQAIHAVDLKVTEVITRQSENHTENKGDIEVLFKKLDDVNTHMDKCPQVAVDGLKQEVTWLKWVVFVVIITGILMKMT